MHSIVRGTGTPKDRGWRQDDVRSQVTWRIWRNWGKYNSLKICLIHFKFCAPSSPQEPSKTGYVTYPTFFNFLSENFIWRKSLTRSRWKWCVIRFTRRRHTEVSHNCTSKSLRFRTFTVQCHMTSQIIGSGKHKREVAVCRMGNKKDDSPVKGQIPHGEKGNL